VSTINPASKETIFEKSKNLKEDLLKHFYETAKGGQPERHNIDDNN